MNTNTHKANYTLSQEINNYLDVLLNTISGIHSIWLLGSRANGTATLESDWDFFVFGEDNVLEEIQANKKFHAENIDLLVVSKNGSFSKPYGHMKTGDLVSWGWRIVTPKIATYKGSKCDDFDPDGDGYIGGASPFKVETLKAIRVRGI